MDLEARNRWVEFAAKDVMFAATDIPQAPWWVVEADVKKRARLNMIGQPARRSPTRTSPRRRPHGCRPVPPVRNDYIRPPKEGRKHRS